MTHFRRKKLYFAGLFYQLCARMVSKAVPEVHADNFPPLLMTLIRRCGRDHPYHILPTVLALANSNADEAEMWEGVKAKKPTTADDDDRTYTAGLLLKKLAKDPLARVVERMRTVSTALIKLAYLAQPKGQVQAKVTIPEAQLIRKVKDFEDVPVSTWELPVSAEGGTKYASGSFPGISQFSASYSNVGGINAPKKISCLGTDGRWRPQLVKGSDDLRQVNFMSKFLRHIIEACIYK